MLFTTYSLLVILVTSLATARVCGVRGARMWSLIFLVATGCAVIATGTLLEWMLAAVAQGQLSGDSPWPTLVFVVLAVTLAIRANRSIPRTHQTPAK